MLQVPQPHKKGVTCITGIMLSPKEAIFASSSSDGAVNIWNLVFPSNNEGEGKGLNCLCIYVDFFD